MSSSSQPPYGQNPFTPPPAPNPYGDGGFYGPPPKPSKGFPVWLAVVLMLVLGGGGLGVLGCCGGVVWFGLSVVSEQVADSLIGNPVIEEHIGEITSCSADFTKTAANGNEDEMVFRVEGTKGKGWIYGKTEDETNALISGSLKMDNGQKYDLFPPLEEVKKE